MLEDCKFRQVACNQGRDCRLVHSQRPYALDALHGVTKRCAHACVLVPVALACGARIDSLSLSQTHAHTHIHTHSLTLCLRTSQRLRDTLRPVDWRCDFASLEVAPLIGQACFEALRLVDAGQQHTHESLHARC
eukprot:6195807-Pleurochrysis_carterae.AAC.5